MNIGNLYVYYPATLAEESLIPTDALVVKSGESELKYKNSSSVIVSLFGGSSGGGTIGGAVSGGTSTGILYVDALGNLAQDVANFNYDPTTQKLTVSGSVDPPAFTASGKNNDAYYELYSGKNSSLSLDGSARIRFNPANNSLEVSINGEEYKKIITE